MKKSKKKESPPIKDNKIRIPRQSGLTMLVRHYNTEIEERKKSTLLNQIKDHVLNHYIKDGFRMNGRTMELSELADYLQIPMKRLVQRITRYGDIMGGKDGEAIARAVKLFAFQGSMATRSLVLGQAHNLIAAQGVEYVPFLTSEVNRALGNLIQTDTTMLNLLKALNPDIGRAPNPVIINNNNQQANGLVPEPQTLLNINQAVKLIADQRDLTLLEDTTQQQALLAQHLGPDVPEVVATQQQGYRASDDAVGLKKKPKKVKLNDIHATRRELEGEIVEDTDIQS